MATDIRARIFLDSSAFTAGLSKATSALTGFAGHVASVAGKVAALSAAFGASFSAAGLVGAVKGALQFADSLEHLSDRTGIGIKGLVVLGKAFQNAGMEASDIGPMLNRMQKAISGVNEEGKPTAAAFDAIGLSIDTIRKLDPYKQFQTISKGIASLPNPADRAAASINLFGRAGGQMLALFRNAGALGYAQKQTEGLAEVMDRSAAKMHAVLLQFENIKTAAMGFFAGLTEPLLKHLGDVGKFIDGLTPRAVALGERLGKELAKGLTTIRQAWEQGKLGELISLNLKIAFGQGADYLIGGVQVAMKILTDTLSNSNLWLAIQYGLIGAAEKFAAAIMKAMAPLGAAWLQADLDELHKKKAAQQKVLDDPQATWAEKKAAKLGMSVTDWSIRTHEAQIASIGEGAGVGAMNALGDKDLNKAQAYAAAASSGISSSVTSAIKGFAPGTSFAEEVAKNQAKLKALTDWLAIGNTKMTVPSLRLGTGINVPSSMNFMGREVGRGELDSGNLERFFSIMTGQGIKISNPEDFHLGAA